LGFIATTRVNFISILLFPKDFGKKSEIIKNNFISTCLHLYDTRTKIGHFFSAVFINDSEENIQATEALIKYNIGGLTFFHSRASAATQL
jgi:hypothetical protein